MAVYAFELDRLEPEDGRLVLTGHWSGVRGLRFMRPTLIVEGREVLATLEHKPWAPLEDRPWIAAFPWSGGPVDARSALLAVGPSITVPLAGGGDGALPKVRERERVREDLESERVRTGRLDTEVRFLRERLATVTEEAARDDAARDDGRERALRAARDEADGLRRDLETLRGRLAEAERARDAARRERDLATEQRDELVRDRDAAVRVRDRAAAERDQALGERDAAVREREEAVARRDDALRHREDALVATRTLERRLRSELAGSGRDERFEHEPDDRPGPVPPRPPAEAGGAPSGDEPLGVRHVPLVRAEPTLGHDATPRWKPTSVDLWVARALGGTAALCFLLLLLTLLLTLT